MSLDPPTTHVRPGDTLSLSCVVNSSHPPITTFRWYKDGAAAGTGPILVLRGVQDRDHGRYHCEAQNAIGTGVAPHVMLYVMCECRWGGSGAGVHPSACGAVLLRGVQGMWGGAL